MNKEEYNQLSASEKKKEDWMNSKWRPAMGWMYMVVCVFDFILAPVLWAIIQFWETQASNDAFRQWQPLTLQGAGLFHMAMGAVLGLAAWGRTQEKLNGANNGGIAMPGAPTPSLSSPSQFGAAGTGFGTAAPTTPSWTSPSNNTFGAQPDSSEVGVGFGGKKAPPPVTVFPEK